ncbi:Uncharacterised protein [Mycobacteroides abscessus subsp. abscessus]|nr:Uncharacterised protein [Mycobacteroides abscessus subsp. abscessus]
MSIGGLPCATHSALLAGTSSVCSTVVACTATRLPQAFAGSIGLPVCWAHWMPALK